MSVLARRDRLTLVYAAMQRAEPCGSEQAVLEMMEAAFDAVEDVYSGVKKNAHAATATASDGRMYSPHPLFRLKNVAPSTYRHRAGHKTVIGENGSLRIFGVGADLTEVVVFEKRGADGKGYWEY